MPQVDSVCSEIAFRSGHIVSVIRGESSDSIELRSRTGQVILTIEASDRGPVLRFEGASLRVDAVGELTIAADTLRLAGRSAVEIRSEGTLDVHADGDAAMIARSHAVESSLGDIRLTANDDVRLVGERVRVNC